MLAPLLTDSWSVRHEARRVHSEQFPYERCEPSEVTIRAPVSLHITPRNRALRKFRGASGVTGVRRGSSQRGAGGHGNGLRADAPRSTWARFHAVSSRSFSSSSQTAPFSVSSARARQAAASARGRSYRRARLHPPRADRAVLHTGRGRWWPVALFTGGDPVRERAGVSTGRALKPRLGRL
jgi:hypothetical protein